MSTLICHQCRTELEPLTIICPGCGARVEGNREEVDWRQQVRQTVARHKEKRKREQARRDDGARQLTIFPERSDEDEEERIARERRAEIRARVEQRLEKRPHAEAGGSPLDAGDVAISRGNAIAARASELDEEPVEGSLDPSTAEFQPLSDLGDEEDLETGATSEPDLDPFASLGLASVGARILSGILDLAFVALIQLTLFYLTTHLVSQRLGALPSSAVAAMILVGSVLALFYFLFFWGLSGQTLGKLVVGVRVVERNGRPLGFGRASLRLLGWLASALPLGAGFIGLWTDPEKRGWHDRIAGSKVVRA